MSAGVMVPKDTRVIHENFVYAQSQCMNQRVFINAVAENHTSLTCYLLKHS